MGRLLLGPLLGALTALSVVAGAPGQQSPGYLALGDSLAFGLGATHPGNGGYVALVHHALQESDTYRQRGLELLNLALPGSRSEHLLVDGGQLDQAIAEIRARAEDDHSGDEVELITIDIGGNDLLALGQADSPCISDPLGAGCQQRFNEVLSAYQNNLTEIMRGLRGAAPGAEIIAVTLYNPFSGTGSQLEIPADVAIALINGSMQAVASSPDVRAKVADPFPLFRGKAHEYIATDGLHPNDRGHRVIADAVLAALAGQPAATQVPITPLAPGGFGLPAATTADSGGGLNVGLLLAIVVPAAAAGIVVVGVAYRLARGRP